MPSVTGIPRDHALYDPVQDTYLGPDKEAAWKLFAEIGITDSDGDGMLEYEDGSDVHIFVPGATNGLLNVETVEALIDEWNKLGVATTMVAADWATIASKMRAGEIALQVSTGVPDYSPFHYLGIWHNRVSYSWGDPIEQPESYDKAFELELAYASATTVEDQQAAAKEFFNQHRHEVFELAGVRYGAAAAGDPAQVHGQRARRTRVPEVHDDGQDRPVVCPLGLQLPARRRIAAPRC